MPLSLEEIKKRFETAGQGHVLALVNTLSVSERESFFDELASVDLALLSRLLKGKEDPPPLESELSPLPSNVLGENSAEDARANELGRKSLAGGKVAAFVVAGGQGTRLGHPGPKGTFPATPIQKNSLFQIFAEKLRRLSADVSASIPLYVMTSRENHDETLDYFRRHNHFGLKLDDLHFFSQGMMPAVSEAGRLLLQRPGSLFQSPDGHGGSLRGLKTSGALDRMRSRGIEEIFYFQVDNPMVRLCDPTFLGYHLAAESEFSSKAVPKRDAHERVGVLVARRGKATVIEYSDLPPGLRDARDDSGALRFRAGNIAVHFLRRSFVERLNDGGFQLPWHRAMKDIPAIDSSGAVATVKGIKFESFVFDALPLAKRTFVLEVNRLGEFSPIKNREGADSPESSASDQSELFGRWLESAGVPVPRDSGGRLRHRLEICPLFADDALALAARRSEIPPITGDLVIEGR